MISDNYYPLLMNFARKTGILYLDTCPPFIGIQVSLHRPGLHVPPMPAGGGFLLRHR